MIISITMLKNALKSRGRVIDMAKSEKRHIEGYNMLDSTNAGMSLGFATGFLIIATVFLMLELLVLFYSISMAMSCTKPGAERVLHVTLAIVFTFPYALLNALFIPCGKKVLRSL